MKAHVSILATSQTVDNLLCYKTSPAWFAISPAERRSDVIRVVFANFLSRARGWEPARSISAAEASAASPEPSGAQQIDAVGLGYPERRYGRWTIFGLFVGERLGFAAGERVA
jgi:hypothetical protein